MPVRDPCGIPMGSTGHGPFDLSIGKPWACPYGASMGLSGGCPCPDRPRSTHGAPYKSRTGSDRERYLGNAYSESLVVGGGGGTQIFHVFASGPCINVENRNFLARLGHFGTRTDVAHHTFWQICVINTRKP